MEIFTLEAWRQALTGAASELAANVSRFLPRLVGAALLLAVGWALARSIEAVAGRALRRLGLDAASARLGLTEPLASAGIALSVSQIVARLLFWLVLLTFLLSSAQALGLDAVTRALDRLIAFIPGLISAGLLAIIGLLLARFAGRVVASTTAAAGFPGAPRLGLATQTLLSGLVLVIALEQLGVATQVLVLPFTVGLAAAGFAVGLAFALGARPLVTHILAGHFLKQSLPREAPVEIDGRSGIVDSVGPVRTVLRNSERAWSVPNARLLDQIVMH
jgi:hypothetical protein